MVFSPRSGENTIINFFIQYITQIKSPGNILFYGNNMKLSAEIDTLMLELTRKGLTPRYIVIGKNQYLSWVRETELLNEEVDNEYMNCNVVICNSDILEVVPEPKEIYEYYKRNK